MTESIIISALSLFTGVSLLPAGFLILRNRAIPIDRQHTVHGTMAIVIALLLLCLGAMFILNVVAQDMKLLIGLLIILFILPLSLTEIDKRLQQGNTQHQSSRTSKTE